METKDPNLPRLLSSPTPRLLRSRALLHSDETDRIIAAAIEVHRSLGPGFLEQIYVNGKIVVEIKAVEQIHEVHLAVTLAYMKATAFPVGLILNFAEPALRVRRVGREGAAMNGEPGKRGAGEEIFKGDATGD